MKIKMILWSLLSIGIVAASWFLNFGFIRLLCSLMMFPLAHVVIVFAMGVVASNYASYRKIRLYNLLFCASYILSNILFPDADELSTKMFFGLIKNEFMNNLGEVLSIIFLIIHIVLLILQIIEIRKIDKLEKSDF